MKNIIQKLNQDNIFFSNFLSTAMDYYGDIQDEYMVEYLSTETDYHEMIKNAPYFWIEENPQKIMEQCPHITYDKTKLIFPSEDETIEKLKEKNDRWDCTEFDRDEIVCVEGNEFLRWIGCPRKNLTPWCLKEKRPICCCDCIYCFSLPLNVRCKYDSFFAENEREIMLRRNNLIKEKRKERGNVFFYL